MKQSEPEITRPRMLSRRHFVQGLAAGGVIA
ncbi:MAG: twin-arginine translocation signal domain-containing protein, partial [Oleispira sp.]|nr:twin-arginine translocation signal domain-containing protein [Oleispira sp.]